MVQQLGCYLLTDLVALALFQNVATIAAWQYLKSIAIATIQPISFLSRSDLLLVFSLTLYGKIFSLALKNECYLLPIFDTLATIRKYFNQFTEEKI